MQLVEIGVRRVRQVPGVPTDYHALRNKVITQLFFYFQGDHQHNMRTFQWVVEEAVWQIGEGGDVRRALAHVVVPSGLQLSVVQR